MNSFGDVPKDAQLFLRTTEVQRIKQFSWLHFLTSIQPIENIMQQLVTLIVKPYYHSEK